MNENEYQKMQQKLRTHFVETIWDEEVSFDDQIIFLQKEKIKFLHCTTINTLPYKHMDGHTRKDEQQIAHCYTKNGQYQFSIPYFIPEWNEKGEVTFDEQWNWDFAKAPSIDKIEWTEKPKSKKAVLWFDPDNKKQYNILK